MLRRRLGRQPQAPAPPVADSASQLGWHGSGAE
jgi:hypothetical protein